MSKRTVVYRSNSQEKSTIAYNTGSIETIPVKSSIEERMTECRHALDTGKCVFIGDRWFPANMPREELNTLIAKNNRRLEKNRRQREYSARIRANLRLEEMISSLPPWVQSKRYGRTAVVTKVNGEWRPVDYGKTYCRRRDIPLPVPGDEIIDAMFDLTASVKSWLSISLDPVVNVPEFAKGILPTNPIERSEVERRNRLRAERRKCNRRATFEKCPTTTDVRVAWAFRRERDCGALHLGAILLNLECYVDNSIVFEHVSPNEERGNRITTSHEYLKSAILSNHPPSNRGSLRIRGRNPGLRGWIRINCPELECHYKTLMRYKAMATKLQQALDVPDPVPLSAILDSGISIKDLWSNGIQQQPRPNPEDDDVAVMRFAWEHAAWEYDANGHLFRKNARYRSVVLFDGGFDNFNRIIERSRREVVDILNPPPVKCSSVDNSSEAIAITIPEIHESITIVFNRIENGVKHRELWWRMSA